MVDLHNEMGRPVEILLVEDNPGDVDLTREAFAESKLTNRVNRVEDGVEALAYLRHEGKYAGVRLPDIILLDLNMPRKDGRAVLAEIKQDPVLRRIPVVILTTSRAEEDIIRTYDLHANCYISKPLDFERFMSVVRQIENFWLTVVQLPSA